MKKNLTSILALILALGALSASLFQLGALKKTNKELNAKLAVLESQIDQLRTEFEKGNDLSEEESAEAYCNLTINDWAATESTLTVDISVQALLPEGTDLSQAQLYLINSSQTQIRDIELLPGEAGGSFEAELTGFTFDLPPMESEDELTLELLVTYTGGNVVHSCISWYPGNGQLSLIAG